MTETEPEPEGRGSLFALVQMLLCKRESRTNETLGSLTWESLRLGVSEIWDLRPHGSARATSRPGLPDGSGSRGHRIFRVEY